MFGSISRNGIEGDGQILAILGFFVVLAVLDRMNKPGRAVIAGIGALVALLMGMYEYSNIAGLEIDSEYVIASVGTGIYVILLGSLMAMAAFAKSEGKLEKGENLEDLQKELSELSNKLYEEQDGKVCPMCAETVRSSAVVCRFCGHKFAELNAELVALQELADSADTSSQSKHT